MSSQRETVKVTWYADNGERRSLQKEKRFQKGTAARIIKAWKAHTESQLRKRIPKPMERGAASGSLTRDAERYYPLIRHLASWRHRRKDLRSFLHAFGDRPRHMIQREDVLRVRGEWIASGVAPKTCNNRVSALRDLYKKLDGDDASSPCDGMKPLHVPRMPPRVIDPATVNTVLKNLSARAWPTHKQGRPCPHALHDRARLMVLASTGKRPCEMERTIPDDVDLLRRVWAVRDAKGGWSEGMYLNDEMLAAWQEFIRVGAWGKIPDHFPRRLRAAGWPQGLRPYCLRHSTWITASERGADLSDIQAGAGHRNIATTRTHYVPVLNSRMQKLSERLEGRFGWVPADAPAKDEESPSQNPTPNGHNGRA